MNKIIHNPLNEYESIADLEKDFLAIPEDMKVTGAILKAGKQKAEKTLLYQIQRFPTNPARVFWYSTEAFEDITYYMMYECIID